MILFPNLYNSLVFVKGNNFTSQTSLWVLAYNQNLQSPRRVIRIIQRNISEAYAFNMPLKLFKVSSSWEIETDWDRLKVQKIKCV